MPAALRLAALLLVAMMASMGTAHAQAPVPNTAPTSDAGPDQPDEVVGSPVTLDGTGSSDMETAKDDLIYFWSQSDGPDVVLSNDRVVRPTFTPPKAGIYTFDLTVTDTGTPALGSTPTDQVIITVAAAVAATTPEPPVLSAETTTHNSIALSWGAVTNAESYTLTRVVVGGADVAVATTTSELTATDTGLTPETPYKYVVTATNSAGTSEDSNEVDATTLATPTVTVARLPDNSIEVSWDNIPGVNFTIYAITTGENDEIIIDLVTSPHTFATTDSPFDTANNADAIGVRGFAEGSPVGDHSAQITSDGVPPADTTPPTVTLGTIAEGVIDTPQDYDITFSEAVTGLAVDDFSVSTNIVASGDLVVNSVTPASGPSTTYTISITPQATVFTLTLAANSVADVAGNTGPVAEASATGTATEPMPTKPVVVAPAPPVEFAENATGIVVTFIATATGDRTIAGFTLGGTDMGDFTLDNSGALTFAVLPNFEAPADANTDNRYEITVTAIVSASETSDALAVTITVTNVDEPGAIAITGDAQVGVTLTAGTVTDEDSPADGTPVSSITHQWQSAVDGTDAAAAVDDAAWPDISGATGATYEPGVGDVGRIIRVVATYTDGEGGGKKVASAATRTVTVAAAPLANSAPTSHAGPNQDVVVGSSVTLDGNGSSDMETAKDDLIYFWSQLDGPDAVLSNERVVSPTFTPAKAGIYLFDLTVTDTGTPPLRSMPTDTVTITVSEPDTTLPTVETFADIAEGVIGTAQDYVITFSEAVTGLAVDDFSVSSNIVASGDLVVNSVTSASVPSTTYTISITPRATAFTLTLAADSVMDTATTPNMGPATAASAIGSATAALALTAPDDQSYTAGTMITELELPKATGGSGTLSYTLTGPADGALPTGLSFDTAPRRLTGTPTALASTELTYTVTDANGARASQTFTVTVALPRFADLNRTILPEVARAIAGHTVGAIARRVTQARADGGTDSAGSFNLGGQTTVAGVAGALASHGQAMADGTLSLKDLLGGGDFVLPLNARAAAGAPGLSSVAFWGAGDYSNLDGSGGAVDWDGDLFSAHLGADARLRDDLLVGLAVSWSRVDLDYSDPGRSGDYELDLTSFHPYVGWSALSGKLDLWATVGYGWGDLEIANEAQQASSDVEMRTVAVGGLGRLLKVGATTLRLKGDALLTEMEVEGSDEMAGLTVDARRVRMILEGSRTHTLADGAQLEPSLEVGVRHDGGDGETGFGAELGGGVRYSNPVMGLTLEGRARTLVGRDSYGEWGVNGLIRLERGNGRGLSFNLSPGYGKTVSGTQRLWQQGVHDKIDGDRDYGARMDLRLGYGLPAFGGRGLLTPYSELTFGDSARNYRLGMEWELGALFELDLTGERHESSDGAADHAIMLKGEVRF